MTESGQNNPKPPKKDIGLLHLAATPDLVDLVRSKPEHLALFKEISMKIARDPVYLDYLEKNFKGPISPAIEELLKETPLASALESHNWVVHPDLPSKKKAAAALLPAAAAI